MTWTNLGAGGWSSWTPSLTGTGSNPSGYSPVSLDNRYQRNGDLIIARFRIYTPSSTGNSVGTGRWRISLPAQPKHSAGYAACGNWYLYNSQAYSSDMTYFGWVAMHSTSQSTSTAELVIQHNSSGTSLDCLPQGIEYTSKYVDIGGQFFYEAL